MAIFWIFLALSRINSRNSSDPSQQFLRSRPLGAKKELKGAKAISIATQSNEKIEKLVAAGIERNKIAERVANAHGSIARSSTVRSWMDAFQTDHASFEEK